MKNNNTAETGEKMSESKFVERHKVILFFILAFAISWTIWLLSPVLSADNDNTKLVFTLIGAYGPALAAMFVSSMATPELSGIRHMRRWGVFVSVFLLVNLIWLLSSEKFGSFNPRNLALFTSKLILAVFVAYVISGVFSGQKGERDLLLPLTYWRVKPVWYLIVLLGFPLLIVVAIWLALLFDVPFPEEYYSIKPQSLYRLLPGLFLACVQTMLFQGPLNEEPGWRGLALPELQKRYGSVIASIMIGIIWGLWHAPLYFTGIYASGIERMLGRLLWTIPLAFLFTWVYNRTNGNLLMAIFLHTSLNLQRDITSLVLQAFRV
jgi:membrane protease YdiL (CAAX protease family)